MQETGPTVYRPYVVIAKAALSPQLIFKTLSIGLAGTRTLDLPHDSLVPIQLS